MRLPYSRLLPKKFAHCVAQSATATAFAWVGFGVFFIVRRTSHWLIVVLLAAAGCGQKPARVVDLASERQRMVHGQLMSRGVRDERVLAAMSKVHREDFVPQVSRAASYADQPLPIGYGQTISQPYIVAFMTEQLHPSSSDRVLEIGTGSGYQAAILGELVAGVYSMAIIEPLGYSDDVTVQRLG